MSSFSDPIKVSGSHASPPVSESTSLASAPLLTLSEAVATLQNTEQTVNLSVGRLAADTETITIRPGADPSVTAGNIVSALGMGADRAEILLVAAVLKNVPAAPSDQAPKTTNMTIRIARAGGSADYAAK